ncbi:ribosomal maturation YjgA family protein [Roseateles sp. P5_E7]
MPLIPRSRPLYVLLVLTVIAAGLASRRYPWLLPTQLGKYPGDALWALMVMLLYGLARPGWSVGRVAAATLATSFAVEFSQLYQADWINAIRHTTPGHLVLGSTFHAPDLLAYTVGVLVGAALERLLLRGPPSPD